MDEAGQEMGMDALEELSFLDSCHLAPFFISPILFKIFANGDVSASGLLQSSTVGHPPHTPPPVFRVLRCCCCDANLPTIEGEKKKPPHFLSHYQHKLGRVSSVRLNGNAIGGS